MSAKSFTSCTCSICSCFGVTKSDEVGFTCGGVAVLEDEGGSSIFLCSTRSLCESVNVRFVRLIARFCISI